MHKTAQDYTALITSQHRTKPKYIASIKTSIYPFIACLSRLSELSQNYDVDTAEDPYLETLARWVGAPLIIPGVTELEYFGFMDQENSLTFGELDDPNIGGYFRESGQSGVGGLVPQGELLRRLIKAKILRNHSVGTLDETRDILKMVLDHDLFVVKDNRDMTVSFKFLNESNAVQKRLVKIFFPLPAGVELIFEN